jgi:hypothetical protein
MSVHMYYIKNFRRYCVTAGLPAILGAPHADTLRKTILNAIQQRLSMTLERLGCILVQYSSDGASVLTEHLNGVGVQLAEIAPFSIHVRCTSHGVNLVGKTAAEQPALKCAVTFAVAPATYYACSTVRMNELNAVQRRLAPAVKPKAVKRNIETRFVSIWCPMQRTWNIY